MSSQIFLHLHNARIKIDFKKDLFAGFCTSKLIHNCFILQTQFILDSHHIRKRSLTGAIILHNAEKYGGRERGGSSGGSALHHRSGGLRFE